MSSRISAFGVTDDHLADSLWLSWTYVADSGNHENSKSIAKEKVKPWKNHTLILGWSDKLGPFLNQLAIANESLGGRIVVVMAERDKGEMELDIANMEFQFRGTSVICRSGSPLILAFLKKYVVYCFSSIAYSFFAFF
ncbi:ion channel CASTOR-like [Primulina eburnea]|uniref:ion channel CASTOR-like n=1 Tax=Primulina eburnea TaxID=1245227 RepID=UPI003C6C4702